MALRDTLKNMVQQAQRTGQPSRVRLAKGLTISIKAENNGQVSVQLSRADVYPSAHEWRTVLQQWPGQVTVVKPPREILGERVFYLKGRLQPSDELVQELPQEQRPDGPIHG